MLTEIRCFSTQTLGVQIASRAHNNTTVRTSKIQIGLLDVTSITELSKLINTQSSSVCESLFVLPASPGGGLDPSIHRRRPFDQVPFEQLENIENPLRCPVKLYEFYLSKWYATRWIANWPFLSICLIFRHHRSAEILYAIFGLFLTYLCRMLCCVLFLTVQNMPLVHKDVKEQWM